MLPNLIIIAVICVALLAIAEFLNDIAKFIIRLVIAGLIIVATIYYLKYLTI